MASSPHLKNPRSSVSAALAARDWASLPPDILISVFLMLGPAEIIRRCGGASTWARGLAVFLRRTGGAARPHGSRRRGVRSLLEALRQPLALLSGSKSTLLESPACEASLCGE
ncbi:uncharacterized protein LOC120711709 [Panicum virgatum]|uniref:F-box domain-containing protein n=1 Tax=Panicum virgatum TaxID=38727 RepID=A0A8T0R8V8_PANVG|nr:uncharacterized protein LOC120711709 [Panicum virgatum]KAG2582227.1 hypothetical protein PVAP13_6KG124435 [Panicum virgatum]